jgi:hypothetical protein
MNLFDGEDIKDVVGYERKYAVTSYGRVWSYKRRIWLKPMISKTPGKRSTKNPTKYVRVNLRNWEGVRKFWFIHILVGLVFVQGRTSFKHEINHKDGDSSNNHKDNLEWCSHSYNMVHAFASGLKDSPDPYKYKRSVCA